MKFLKRFAAVLAVLMLSGCGTVETVPQLSGEPMTISPTEFSAETKKVLDILDDEVMFYTYIIDETVKSVRLELWLYEDGEWTSAGNVKGNEDVTERDIVLRIKDTEIDLIQVSDSGQNKYTFPMTQEYTGAMMTLEECLQHTESIVPEEEVVLYYKVGTDADGMFADRDFRHIPCSAGMALTITFSAEDAE